MKNRQSKVSNDIFVSGRYRLRNKHLSVSLSSQQQIKAPTSKGFTGNARGTDKIFFFSLWTLLRKSWVVGKMKVAILLAILAFASGTTKYSCYQRTYYARVCYRFEFQGECQPWDLSKCKPIRTTTHDYRCPKYYCVSSFSILSVGLLSPSLLFILFETGFKISLVT